MLWLRSPRENPMADNDTLQKDMENSVAEQTPDESGDATNATLEGLAAKNPPNYVPPAPPPTPIIDMDEPVTALGPGGVAQAAAKVNAGEAAGIVTETEGKSNQLGAMSAIEDTKSDMLATQVADEQQLNRTSAEQYARSHGDLFKMASSIGQTQVDPDHWWNNKDTGGKVAAGIGLLFGGIGQGLMNWGSHGQGHAANTAIDAIDNAIKRDIDSQQKNIENQWKEYATKFGLADNETNYNNYLITRKHAEWDTAMKVIDSQAQSVVDQTQDPILKGQMLQRLAALQRTTIAAEAAWGNHVAGQAAAVNTRANQLADKEAEREEARRTATELAKSKKEELEVGAKATEEVNAAKSPEEIFKARTTALMGEASKADQQAATLANTVLPNGMFDSRYSEAKASAGKLHQQLIDEQKAFKNKTGIYATPDKAGAAPTRITKPGSIPE